MIKLKETYNLNSAFYKWFGKSQCVDANGKPVVYYHGSNKANLTDFKLNSYGILFLSPNKEEAENFTGHRGGKVYECYVKAENIFDGFNPEHIKAIGEDPDNIQELRLFDSGYVEDWFIQEKIKKAGYDAFYVRDYPVHDYSFRNIGVYSPTQIKAVDNKGTWNATSNNIYESTSQKIVAFHGSSKEEPFTEFSEDFSTNRKTRGSGFFFTANDKVAMSYAGARGYIYEVELSLQNPLIIDALGNNWRSFRNSVVIKDNNQVPLTEFIPIEYLQSGQDITSDWLARQVRRQEEWDGIIIKNLVDPGSLSFRDGPKPSETRAPSTVYVVFDSKQIEIKKTYKAMPQ